MPTSPILLYFESPSRSRYASSTPAEKRALGFSPKLSKAGGVATNFNKDFFVQRDQKKNFPVLTPNTASLRKYRSFLSEMIFEVTTRQVIIKGEATICGK